MCNRSLLGKYFLSHPKDCAMYYVCFNGRKFLMKCEDNEVFHVKSGSCVQRGSEFDSCSQKDNTEDSECSPHYTGLLAHLKNCAKYLDCSSKSSNRPRIRECPYPYLFDSVAMACRYFTEVDCGDRQEPKNPCDYDVKPCNGDNCTPCRSHYPSCVHYPDGLNPWRGREWTPHFILCTRERVLFHGLCSHSQIFHPRKLKCFDPNTHRTNSNTKI
ncbi:uncharacterized protein LOC133187968 [Saccostrea echinata]|uniref:uncharacterized protein LOC133187968 n=1 Tax=Saccostrea echinata TaxID=191078 RepID=UPI002A836A0C|nr:uncharacterized protein LOC133187968 [Saccostrea echinata]